MNVIKPLIAGIALVAVSIATLAAQPAHATTNTCVDGSKRSNFSITWNTPGNVSVKTLGDNPLCADTTLYFSSYTMPDNYNGLPFANNPTASPQSIFDSTSIVLKKGTNGTANMAIDLPEACKNIQVDVYYGPEITTVTAAGHGKQYISGKIIAKTQDKCDVPETPEVPEVPKPEAQTPETPAPKVQTPAPVAELPKTGSSLAGFALAGITVSAATYAAVYVAQKRQ